MKHVPKQMQYRFAVIYETLSSKGRSGDPQIAYVTGVRQDVPYISDTYMLWENHLTKHAKTNTYYENNYYYIISLIVHIFSKKILLSVSFYPAILISILLTRFS